MSDLDCLLIELEHTLRHQMVDAHAAHVRPDPRISALYALVLWVQTSAHAQASSPEATSGALPYCGRCGAWHGCDDVPVHHDYTTGVRQ